MTAKQLLLGELQRYSFELKDLLEQRSYLESHINELYSRIRRSEASMKLVNEEIKRRSGQ